MKKTNNKRPSDFETPIKYVSYLMKEATFDFSRTDVVFEAIRMWFTDFFLRSAQKIEKDIITQLAYSYFISFNEIH